MKNQFFKFTLAVVILFIIINNFLFVPVNILSYDTLGYYLYLPLKFIYNDLGLHHLPVLNALMEKYENTNTLYQVIKTPEGKLVLQYTMGLSFFYAPFFFIGHFLSGLTNYPPDGFSPPYQYAIFFGGIIYSIIGILALAKVLRYFFSEKISSVVTILIVFSTNYTFNITMHGGNAMSHNYLFTTYACILWLCIAWHQNHQLKYAALLGLLCGLSILSRPSEIVCLIIPALWGIKDIASITEKIKFLTKFKTQLLVFVLILLLIGSCQILYWKIYTGTFLFYNYGATDGHGFDFFSPHIINVLFSYRKGWLIYTPIMLFAIFGFRYMYSYNRNIFFALFIYFILNIYIVSSWSCWWYSHSFSSRALIPSYPIMAISLGYFLTWLTRQNKFLKRFLLLVLTGLTLLNVFQTLQYHYGTLDGNRMTKAYYWKIFGKLHATDEDKKFLLINRNGNGIEHFMNSGDYHSRMLHKLGFENEENRDSTFSHSGIASCKLDSSTIYSQNISAPYFELTTKDHAWIKVTVFIYPTSDYSTDPFSLIVHFTHHEKAYKYYAYNSENMKLELNTWNKIVIDYLTPEVRSKSDYLKVYVWNRGKATIYVDDLQVNVFEKK